MSMVPWEIAPEKYQRSTGDAGEVFDAELIPLDSTQVLPTIDGHAEEADDYPAGISRKTEGDQNAQGSFANGSDDRGTIEFSLASGRNDATPKIKEDDKPSRGAQFIAGMLAVLMGAGVAYTGARVYGDAILYSFNGLGDTTRAIPVMTPSPTLDEILENPSGITEPDVENVDELVVPPTEQTAPEDISAEPTPSMPVSTSEPTPSPTPSEVKPTNSSTTPPAVVVTPAPNPVTITATATQTISVIVTPTPSESPSFPEPTPSESPSFPEPTPSESPSFPELPIELPGEEAPIQEQIDTIKAILQVWMCDDKGQGEWWDNGVGNDWKDKAIIRAYLEEIGYSEVVIDWFFKNSTDLSCK